MNLLRPAVGDKDMVRYLHLSFLSFLDVVITLEGGAGGGGGGGEVAANHKKKRYKEEAH